MASSIAVIRVYDDAGNVIEMHEHAGDFKEWPRGPSRLLLFAELLETRIVPKRVPHRIETQQGWCNRSIVIARQEVVEQGERLVRIALDRVSPRHKFLRPRRLPVILRRGAEKCEVVAF